MSNQPLENLEHRVVHLEQAEKHGKDIWDKISAIGTIFLPIVLAVLGYFVSEALRARDRDSTEHLASQEKATRLLLQKQDEDFQSALKKQDQDFQKAMRDIQQQNDEKNRRMEYLKLVYQDAFSQTPERKKASMKLLSQLGPELQLPLLEALGTDSDESVRQEAQRLMKTKDLVEKLNLDDYYAVKSYSIVFVTDLANSDEREEANSIVDALKFARFTGSYPIQSHSKDKSGWALGTSTVRYTRGNADDEEAAKEFGKLLEVLCPARKFSVLPDDLKIPTALRVYFGG